MLKLLLKKTNAAFPSDTCDGSSDKFDHDYLLAEESHTLNEERVQKKVVLLLACCIWSKLGIWKRFLPVWWKNVWFIFKDLAPASDQFFRHLSQFFCVLRELLENVIKKEARGVPSILRSFYVQRGWKRLEKSIKETVGRRLTFDVRRIGLFVLLALLHHSSFLSSHLGSTLLFPCFLARKLTSFAICRMFLLSWYSEVCKMKSLGTFGVKYISRLGCVWRVAYNISFQKLGTTDITLLQENKC